MPLDAPPLHPPVGAVRVAAPYVAAAPYAAGGRRTVRLVARPGQTVRAPCAGRVAFVGRVAAQPLAVSLACAGGVERITVSGLASTSRRGQGVAQGAVIGRALASTVGLSLRVDGRYTDPVPRLAQPVAAPPVGAARPRQRQRPGRPFPRPVAPPEVRLAPQSRAVHASSAAAEPDRWLGGIGIAVALTAAAAAGISRSARRHRPVVLASHRVAPRR